MLFCLDAVSAELAIMLMATPMMIKITTSGTPIPKSILGFNFIQFIPVSIFHNYRKIGIIIYSIVIIFIKSDTL